MKPRPSTLETREKIMQDVSQNTRLVGPTQQDMADRLGMSRTNLRHHIRNMVKEGLIRQSETGRIAPAIDMLNEAKRLADLRYNATVEDTSIRLEAAFKEQVGQLVKKSTNL